MENAAVTYVLVNNLGGITSMLSSLIEYRGQQALPQEAIMLNIKENNFAPSTAVFGNGIPVKYFSYSKKENWYHVFGKLARMIGNSPGVLVSNDVYDMLMLQAFRLNKKVVQIVHDAYNVELALTYGEVVDKFICHSHFYYEVLCQLLPGRKKDIVHLPYGIPLTGNRRKMAGPNDPLKLLFLGRHDERKGVLDLFEINRQLQEMNVPVEWLIMGRGPLTEQVKKQWSNNHNVVFDSPATWEEVATKITAADVFVFPTRFEGFPVALLETMAAGVVPVATDLPGGLRELVKDGRNGFLCAENDNAAFAAKVALLHQNRHTLESMSGNAFDEVNQHYNAAIQSPKYQAFFNELNNQPGPPKHHAARRKIGSRLDQAWIPNIVTKALRGQYG